jgi:hypothetical protein
MKRSSLSMALSIILVTTIFYSSTPARAQPVSSKDIPVSVTKIFDAIVRYPAPSWYKPSIQLDQSEYFRDQKGPSFIIEQIPKGEKFDDWSKLHAVRGIYIGKNRTVVLRKFAMATVVPFFQVCGKENVRIDPIVKSADTMTFMIICSNSTNMKAASVDGTSVYGEGIGQVGLYRLFKFRNTFIKIYQEWRGKKFNKNDIATWPVNQKELNLMKERFKLITISG